MGVYIPNMKMPEHCGECRFAVDGWCYAYGKPNIDALANDGRTNFCPLVPVPPHGRLIDADALIDAIIAKYIRHERNRELVFAAAEIKQDLADIINELPTIIPAEEGE